MDLHHRQKNSSDTTVSHLVPQIDNLLSQLRLQMLNASVEQTLDEGGEVKSLTRRVSQPHGEEAVTQEQLKRRDWKILIGVLRLVQQNREREQRIGERLDGLRGGALVDLDEVRVFLEGALDDGGGDDVLHCGAHVAVFGEGGGEDVAEAAEVGAVDAVARATRALDF